MTGFQGKRVAHEYKQHNVAPPEKVFPLICPVREETRSPGWEYRLIFSQSGAAEPGCVFSTPNGNGTETTWVVTKYDPVAFRIAFTWVNPGTCSGADHSLARTQRTGHIRRADPLRLYGALI